MAPTILSGDTVITIFAGDALKRGDIVAYQPPALDQNAPPRLHRVVGLLGEKVETRDGMVWTNGKALSEPYLAPGTKTRGLTSVQVPEDAYWLMGDNRDRAADSRVYGPIRREAIYAIAIRIDSPPNRRRSLR